MSVVVGYVASEEGRAALRYAFEEARLRGTHVVVVVIEDDRGSRRLEEDLAHARASASGSADQETVVRVPEQGQTAANELVGALVRGRRRARRCRASSPVARAQVHAG